jgi:hypothetical protein
MMRLALLILVLGSLSMIPARPTAKVAVYVHNTAAENVRVRLTNLTGVYSGELDAGEFGKIEAPAGGGADWVVLVFSHRTGKLLLNMPITFKAGVVYDLSNKAYTPSAFDPGVAPKIVPLRYKEIR